MKTSSEVTADKLRGGFYSPESLVEVCLDRIASLVGGAPDALRVLEPSAGDGAFITGLSRHALGARVSWVTAIEILGSEAEECASRLRQAGFAGEVLKESALAWASRNPQVEYDVAVGNPPFVRFQFVDPAERPRSEFLASRVGLQFRGVSNLWLPILVAALASLRPGGVFSFIVPSECFTGIAGHDVREWLLANVRDLSIDLFAPGSFPGVLQEVVVLSGQTISQGCPATRNLHMREHRIGGTREWTHASVGEHRTWTRYLLTPAQVQALETVTELPRVTPLSAVARFEVATVTGANSFFCVDEPTANKYDLWQWTRTLLPRTRYAKGLAYRAQETSEVDVAGQPGYLLDFSANAPDPTKFPGAQEYLALGESMDLPGRYKCRIRDPWFRVPVVAPGAMLMAKRSHFFPRVIVNEVAAVTTDTIYRGKLLPDAGMSLRDFTAAFHSSLTLLTAEIEGRSFGGGVLELVPSEISRLSVIRPDDMGDEFERLDWVCRQGGADANEALVEETDALVAKKTPGLTKGLLSDLREARQVLLALRLARN